MKDFHEYKRRRWRFAYLLTDTRLTIEQRDTVALEAIKMYHARGKKREIKGDTYEGEVRDTGKSGVMGTYCGQVFEAELETDFGKANIRFIVMAPQRADLN